MNCFSAKVSINFLKFFLGKFSLNHSFNPSKVIGPFDNFFKVKNIAEFYRREYETIDFRIGIGINYGPVIFDYFGVSGSRIFAPLGDHVNFAKRLESEAHRFDSQLRDRDDRRRAPILVSRPAWIASDEFEGPKRSLSLSIKGKPNEIECYEFWPK